VKWIFFTLLAGLVLSGEGCRRTTPDSAPGTEPQEKQYPVRAKVVSTDAAAGEVVLDAQAIPGYMGAMTMPYKMRTPRILSELHPGDQITATLFVTDTSSLLDQIVITGTAQPDYKPPMQYHVPAAGDLVPEFKFRNQSGRHISVGDFKGKILLVTFIYTRCPLPDYCARMNRNFAAIEKALAADPALYAKTHLLTLSFDPGFDTPAVLRSYGGAYTGRFTQENFAHWDFAVPSKADLESVDTFFDVGVTPEKDHSITHSLSTAVIGPDGRIFSWYPTNDWTIDQVLADVRKLASRS
jgi:protein SCO1